MKIILAQPRGFCAGVVRAIDSVERALEKYGAPVYVRHEIVHNRHVVESLKAKGARFVEELSEVPSGAVTIFSAHGVSRKVENEARSRALPIIDATCPLVTKVHNQGRRYVAQGRILVFIGHAVVVWRTADDHSAFPAARRMFRFSLLYLAVLFAALPLDGLVARLPVARILVG